MTPRGQFSMSRDISRGVCWCVRCNTRRDVRHSVRSVCPNQHRSEHRTEFKCEHANQREPVANTRLIHMQPEHCKVRHQRGGRRVRDLRRAGAAQYCFGVLNLAGYFGALGGAGRFGAKLRNVQAHAARPAVCNPLVTIGALRRRDLGGNEQRQFGGGSRRADLIEFVAQPIELGARVRGCAGVMSAFGDGIGPASRHQLQFGSERITYRHTRQNEHGQGFTDAARACGVEDAVYRERLCELQA
jgi:hypothetical protein